MEVTVLFRLIMRVTSHTFAVLQVTRPAHTQGRHLYKGMNTRRQKSLNHRTAFRIYLPQCSAEGERKVLDKRQYYKVVKCGGIEITDLDLTHL